jgi:hypothetical protein
MKDYQDIERFKKRVRALVGPRPASQHLYILEARGPFIRQRYAKNMIFFNDFVKVPTKKHPHFI